MKADRVLTLAQQAKREPYSIEILIQEAMEEIRTAELKRAGKKDIYKTIRKVIEDVIKNDTHTVLYGIFPCKGRWAVANGAVGVWFANLDPSDLPVEKGVDLDMIVEDFKRKAKTTVTVLTEAELAISWRKQKAENKAQGWKCDCYEKIGDYWYAPKQLTFLLSMMQVITTARQGEKGCLYLEDSDGTQGVAMPLTTDRIQFRPGDGPVNED
jgi:hypothetical protein